MYRFYSPFCGIKQPGTKIRFSELAATLWPARKKIL